MLLAFLVGIWPSMPLAADDFRGTWQPYSKVGYWFGTLIIDANQVTYGAGPRAGLGRVRKNGSVFRLIDPSGGAFEDCGNASANFIGFRMLDNGLLAVLHYLSDDPPPEPRGNTALEIVRNKACSVAFYERPAG